MNKVFISTGTMLGRPNGRDISLIKDVCPLLECDGLELMMYDSWHDSIDKVKYTIKSLTLPVEAFHVEKQTGELISHDKLNSALELFELNCKLAKELGSKILILHLWNGIISDRNISYNIECFKYLRQIAERYELELTVENVVCNQLDPMTHFRTLIDTYPDIFFTFDTKMAEFHKQIDLIYKSENRDIANNIRHMHINDYMGEYKDWSNLKVLHIGTGEIDFDKFFSFVKEIGYSGNFTLEATSFDQNGIINTKSLNESVKKIKSLLK